MVMASVGAYCISDNTYLLGVDREDLPTYRFAKHIGKVENASLLNYRFLDGGFYHAANVLPATKFFCLLNANIPGMGSKQDDIVNTGAADFVVSRNKKIESNFYKLIDETEYRHEDIMHKYYLYQHI